MGNIFLKLLEVQTKLKATKSQFNKFGKYYYRACEDILEAAKPLLLEQKTVILLSDTIELIGQRYYIKATARFIDVETGEEISNTAFAREEETKKGMDGSQITGASSSYARKYALSGLLCIDDNKDSDSLNHHNHENKENTSNENIIDIVCSDCGKKITGNGKVTAAQVVSGTTSAYGRPLCNECGKKLKLERRQQEQDVLIL